VVLPTGNKTLFLGNPPYVRHHSIEAAWKQWLIEGSQARAFGQPTGGTARSFLPGCGGESSSGRLGAFVTAAEWLDVNYGSLLRNLFLRELGGREIVVIEPSAMPFPDAATTAAITFFQVGARPKSVKLKRIARLDELEKPNGHRSIPRERLEAERRWSHLTRVRRKGPEDFIELGELCRVHRGQVTGLNKVWIAGAHSAELPESVLFPSVTRARELIRVGPVLTDASALRRVIDLPIDLEEFNAAERKVLGRFLSRARSLGAHLGYVATNRKAWWSVGLRSPAPILATSSAGQAYQHRTQNLPARTHERSGHHKVGSVPVSVGRCHGRPNLRGGPDEIRTSRMERLLVPNLKLLTGT